MISFTQGNLLQCRAEALVNTVNTVGVMGKGIALMFKEAFPENFKAYAAACKEKLIKTGTMYVTERQDLVDGPRWIINFPTKQHWRHPSKLQWIEEGLRDLRRVIEAHQIKSIAIPPLGSGNGGLDWSAVRPLIEKELGGLDEVEITVFEPSNQYHNVAKRSGVEELTPARAMVAEAVRAYWVLGFECSLLEIQKLAYLLGRAISHLALPDTLKLKFEANRYGPYAHGLTHLLDRMDGSYLHCGKRLADADPFDVIWFEDAKADAVGAYMSSTAKDYLPALELVENLIDGFQTPLGMELLATVDWLVAHQGATATVEDIKAGLQSWPGGSDAGQRKLRLFDDRMIALALERLAPLHQSQSVQ